MSPLSLDAHSPTPDPLDLLLIVAHPDDEVYGTGGTIIEYSQAGKRVGLITLTDGGSGRSLGLADSQAALVALRAKELQNTVAALGIVEFVHYNYPDAGSPDRSQAIAVADFVGGLQDQDFEALVARVLADLLRLRPRVVLTFPPDGGNRHPDHIWSHRIALAAVARAEATLGPIALFCYAFTQPPRPEWADTWLPATHSRDVSQHLAQKLRAIACHRTQALSTVDFLHRFAERITTETFRRLSPPWEGSEMGRELE
jgi:N-acetylglucosamine malate deacetylase 2